MSRLVSIVSCATLVLAASASTASAELIRDRLGIGLHAGGGGIEDENAEDGEELELGGGGIDISYRVSNHWDIELSLGGLEGENTELRRSFGIVTLGATYCFNPLGRWQWSLGGGLGSADERAEVLDPAGETIVEREFRHDVIYLGGALERRWNRIGVSLELRAMGLTRDDSELDGPEFAGKDSPVPHESGGGELRLGATYYF